MKLDERYQNAEETGSFDLMPAGEYLCMAIEEEEKETKSGGMMLVIKFQIIDDKCNGRYVWQNFNVENANEKAVHIAFQELKRLGKAVGKPDCGNTEEFMNIPFRAKIGIEPGKNGYEDRNKIKDYKPANDSASAPAAPVPAQPNHIPESAPAPAEPVPDKPWWS